MTPESDNFYEKPGPSTEGTSQFFILHSELTGMSRSSTSYAHTLPSLAWSVMLTLSITIAEAAVNK